MADITTTDAAVMCHADESTIPVTVEVPTVHLIKGESGGGGGIISSVEVLGDWS